MRSNFRLPSPPPFAADVDAAALQPIELQAPQGVATTGFS